MQENLVRKDLTKFFLLHSKIYNLDEGTAILGIRIRSTLCGGKEYKAIYTLPNKNK